MPGRHGAGILISSITDQLNQVFDQVAWSVKYQQLTVQDRPATTNVYIRKSNFRDSLYVTPSKALFLCEVTNVRRAPGFHD